MVKIYSLKGRVKGNIKLSDIFNTEYRPDLIKRAVVMLQANRRQKYGANPLSGMRTTAEYFGRRRDAYRQTINRGISRLPRIKPGGGGLGDVRRVPQAVGGRRAHPPKMRDYSKKMNKKEYQFALKSAIAATKDIRIVKGRGHIIDNIKEIPLVVEDSFQRLKKTNDVINVLYNLGLKEDLERAKEKRIRAGRGKLRGRKYKRRKSILIVIHKDDGIKNVKNIPGVDIVNLDELDVELLAPGTHPGRLTLWTKSALDNIENIICQNGC